MEVRIEKLVYGGDGLAHHEGQTVFVPLVLPGELVSIAPAERKKKFVRGRLERVVEAAPERVAAPCPYFGRCGGCHYQHIPYDAQIRYKTEILRETLGRIGRVRWDGPIATHASPPFGYRNRTQWKIRTVQEGSAAPTGIGYFEAGSTRLCAVDECAILSPRLAETLAKLRTLAASGKALSAIDEIEAFADDADQKILLNLSSERLTESPEAIASALRASLPWVESILVQDRRADKFELFGPGYLSYSAGGANFRVGHLSFFQVNRFLIDALVEAVIGDSKRTPGAGLVRRSRPFHRGADKTIRPRDWSRIESCCSQGFGSQPSVERRSFSDASARHNGSISFALAGAARLGRPGSAAGWRRARDADAAQKTRALAH